MYPLIGPCGRAFIAAAIMVSLSGCTSVGDYLRNGFKVGPNYQGAKATTAGSWIDAADARIKQESGDLSIWWTVFQDPVLDSLVTSAKTQNLSLREAGFRILQARAQLGIARGNVMPQSQFASGSYNRVATPGGTSTDVTVEVNDQTEDLELLSERDVFDQFNLGFSLAWELDFWGRFRRAIAAAEATLEASYAGYDEVLVTLLADVAASYVQIRTLETRIEFVNQNVEEQRKIASIVRRLHEIGDPRPERRFDQPRKYHVEQIESILAQTESQIPQLQIELREASNRLCVLLGKPPYDLVGDFPTGPIPTAPAEVIVGIPADLLRRRPDIRRAERQVAAQAEEIGIAEVDLYPIFTITGTVGYESRDLGQLFKRSSFTGSIGPSFQWNILDYGRTLNNVRLQDARFRELLTAYQNSVLRANAEVENGLVRFIKAQDRAGALDRSVEKMQNAVDGIEAAKELRGADANQIAVITQTKVQQQDLQAQAHGEVVQGLIQVYRALGGGWRIPVPHGNSPPITSSPDTTTPQDEQEPPDAAASGDQTGESS